MRLLAWVVGVLLLLLVVAEAEAVGVLLLGVAEVVVIISGMMTMMTRDIVVGMRTIARRDVVAVTDGTGKPSQSPLRDEYRSLEAGASNDGLAHDSKFSQIQLMI
jgi:hypothetical protein